MLKPFHKNPFCSSWRYVVFWYFKCFASFSAQNLFIRESCFLSAQGRPGGKWWNRLRSPSGRICACVFPTFYRLRCMCTRYWWYPNFQITVTPLGALTNADTDSHKFFNQWLPGVASSAVWLLFCKYNVKNACVALVDIHLNAINMMHLMHIHLHLHNSVS